MMKTFWLVLAMMIGGVFAEPVPVGSKSEVQKAKGLIDDLVASGVDVEKLVSMAAETEKGSERFWLYSNAFILQTKEDKYAEATETLKALQRNVTDIPEVNIINLIERNVGKKIAEVPELAAMLKESKARLVAQRLVPKLKQDIRKNPKDAKLKASLGEALAVCGDWKAALEAFAESQGKVSSIAKAELEAKRTMKIAEHWWDYKPCRKLAPSKAFKTHATGIYTELLKGDQLSVVEKTLAERRIASLSDMAVVAMPVKASIKMSEAANNLRVANLSEAHKINDDGRRDDRTKRNEVGFNSGARSTCQTCIRRGNGMKNIVRPQNYSSMMVGAAAWETFRDNVCEYKYVVNDGGVQICHAEILQGGSFSGVVEIPSKIENFEVRGIVGAFLNCHGNGVTSFIIPNTVSTIRGVSFGNCDSLTSVKIPSSVLNLNDGRAGCVFRNCNKLNEILVDEANPNFCSVDGVLYNKDKTELLFCPAGKQKVSILSTVVNIGENAFFGGNIESVDVPEGVVKLCYFAFGHCKRMRAITLPASLELIADFCFSRCDNLTSIEVSPKNPYFRSFEGILYDKAGRRLKICPCGRDTVRFIDSVESIEYRAFENCLQLKSITLPSALKQIRHQGFLGCGGLTNVVLNEGLVAIGSGAFSGCDNLVELTVPASVVAIEGNAFDNCAKLCAVKVAAGNKKYRTIDGVLYNKELTRIVSCPSTKCSIAMPDTICNIVDSAFSGCMKIESIDIPANVEMIGRCAFANCANLKRMSFAGLPPNGLKDACINKKKVEIRYDARYREKWEPVLASLEFYNVSMIGNEKE